MRNRLLKQFAPELELPPRGQWTTAEQVGLAGESNLYDTRGTPLNYIQQEGGQREFLLPHGAQLRGTLPFHDERRPNIEAPRDLIRQPDAPPVSQLEPGLFGSINPPRAVVPVPQQGRPNERDYPLGGLDPSLYGSVERQSAGAGIQPPESPSPTSRSANASNPRARPARGGTGNSGPPLLSNRATIAQEQRDQNGSLGDMLRSFNFQLPILNRRQDDGLRDRSGMDLFDMMNSQVPTSAPLENRNGEVVPVSSRQSGITLNLATSAGRADFQRRMGLTLSEGQMYRDSATQAELDGISGRNSSTRSYHEVGRAFDASPRQLGGLTEQSAVAEVTRRMQRVYNETGAEGYNPANYSIRWHTRGTAPHVHVEPRRGR